MEIIMNRTKFLAIVISLVTVFCVAVIAIFLNSKRGTEIHFSDRDINNSIDVVELCKQYANHNLSKYDTASIRAELSSDGKGVWNIQLVERMNDTPHLFYATVDTERNIIYNYSLSAYNVKLYEGRLPSDAIDSDTAVKCALDAYANVSYFRYDKISVDTISSYYRSEPVWIVCFDDTINKRFYQVEVDLTNGSIVASDESAY